MNNDDDKLVIQFIIFVLIFGMLYFWVFLPMYNWYLENPIITYAIIIIIVAGIIYWFFKPESEDARQDRLRNNRIRKEAEAKATAEFNSPHAIYERKRKKEIDEQREHELEIARIRSGHYNDSNYDDDEPQVRYVQHLSDPNTGSRRIIHERSVKFDNSFSDNMMPNARAPDTRIRRNKKSYDPVGKW